LRGEADGLALFHWSTTGGDPRVAHFTALHAMPLAPLAVWCWPRGGTIWLSAMCVIIMTAAPFVQAIMGVPLFAV
jgi:hypothetical protein